MLIPIYSILEGNNILVTLTIFLGLIWSLELFRENKEELLSWIKYIKDNGSKVGLCIKPNTKIEEIYEFLPYIHTVLVMTVEPGEGGQSLIPETIEKIRKLKEHIENHGLEVDIEADGGINEENSGILKDAGCDIIVAGTAIINSDNFKDAVKKLK